MVIQMYLIAVGSGLGTIVFLLSIACCCGFCKKKKKKGPNNEHLTNRQNAKQNYYDMDRVVDVDSSMQKQNYMVDDEVVKKLNKRKRRLSKILGKKRSKHMKGLTIDSNRVIMGKVIGEGNFGVVYEGVLNDDKDHYQCDVAVKCISGDAISNEILANFVDEAMRMRYFSHPNVLTAIGFIIEDNMPKVIMPKMDNGDIRSYVADISKKITGRDLARFAFQIACGMEYLSANGFVHRDLAARNCMVDKSLTVKVADFGLSRDLFDAEYYKSECKVPLPVRWMAIESLTSAKFSTKSDVWAFGILLWELYTRGAKPYTGLDNTTVISYVSSGKRMKKPPNAPDIISDLMEQCWATKPSDRPTFKELADTLREICSDTSQPLANSEESEYLNFEFSD